MRAPSTRHCRSYVSRAHAWWAHRPQAPGVVFAAPPTRFQCRTTESFIPATGGSVAGGKMPATTSSFLRYATWRQNTPMQMKKENVAAFSAVSWRHKTEKRETARTNRPRQTKRFSARVEGRPVEHAEEVAVKFVVEEVTNRKPSVRKAPGTVGKPEAVSRILLEKWSKRKNVETMKV